MGSCYSRKGEIKIKNKGEIKIKNFRDNILLVNHSQNIKSKYILKQIFWNLTNKKKLVLVKFNKKIQARLDLGINDYKDYSEKLTPIEIELFFINKKKYSDCNEFMSITEKERKYFHIYINDSKKEIENNYLNKDEDIKKINIIIDYQIKSFYRLFYYSGGIKKINFIKF